AGIFLVLLLGTNLLRSNPKVSRFRDVYWLAWIGMPLYLVHQFEEHAVDALGRHYAFRGFLCTTLGFPDADPCPVPVSFMTAVEVGVVWVAIPLSVVAGRNRPLLALSVFATPIVNAAAHIVPAIARMQYNPGVLTAVTLFVLVSFWVMRTAVRERFI